MSTIKQINENFLITHIVALARENVLHEEHIEKTAGQLDDCIIDNRQLKNRINWLESRNQHLETHLDELDTLMKRR